MQKRYFTCQATHQLGKARRQIHAAVNYRQHYD